jgi:ABC-type amino acid transport substrate-binding protein
VAACFPAKPFGIAIRKDNPGLLAALNAALTEEQSKGSLKKLFAPLALPAVKGSSANEACR